MVDIDHRLRNQMIDDPVREVDAGAALQSLLVQGSVFLHILGDVGDMNTEDVVLPVFPERDRVVEILRVVAVNGDHGNIPEIHPTVLSGDMM